MSLPDVGLLLQLDREYREKAAAGALQKIAPRRLSADGEAWLPVMHARCGPWRFTVLYSNAEPVREVQGTCDWVVIYFDDAMHDDGQATVVTEYRGALKGQRVVRGLELDCTAHYRALARLPREAFAGS